MDSQRVNDAVAVGTWGAILSSMAALVGVVVQNMIAYMKVRSEIEHQRALDDYEKRRMFERLQELEREIADEHGSDADA